MKANPSQVGKATSGKGAGSQAKPRSEAGVSRLAVVYCTSCKTAEATLHCTEIKDGGLSRLALCDACARALCAASATSAQPSGNGAARPAQAAGSLPAAANKEALASTGREGALGASPKHRAREIFFGFERAQQMARGLLGSLSDAVRASMPDEDGAVGLGQAASDLAENVAFQWERLSKAWTEQRESDPALLDSLEVMPQKLRAAFEDMVPAMRCAAACVHSLALSLKQRAVVKGKFHADCVAGGYEGLAVYWASEILLPGDMMTRPDQRSSHDL